MPGSVVHLTIHDQFQLSADVLLVDVHAALLGQILQFVKAMKTLATSFSTFTRLEISLSPLASKIQVTFHVRQVVRVFLIHPFDYHGKA